MIISSARAGSPAPLSTTISAIGTTIPVQVMSATFTDVRLSQKDGHAWSIGGRLGVLSSPSTLLFVSAGWTQVSTEADLSFVFDGTERRLTLDKERDGWFVGAGIETQLGWLGSGFSLRGEYRFTRLDDDHRRLTLAEDSCGVGCDRRLAFDRDIDVHSVRAVLVYKFGRREEPAPNEVVGITLGSCSGSLARAALFSGEIATTPVGTEISISFDRHPCLQISVIVRTSALSSLPAKQPLDSLAPARLATARQTRLGAFT